MRLSLCEASAVREKRDSDVIKDSNILLREEVRQNNMRAGSCLIEYVNMQQTSVVLRATTNNYFHH